MRIAQVSDSFSLSAHIEKQTKNRVKHKVTKNTYFCSGISQFIIYICSFKKNVFPSAELIRPGRTYLPLKPI